jgi:SAM-dependent methyltransferase
MKQIFEKIAMWLKHYIILFYTKIENSYFHKINHISDTEYEIRKMFLKWVETKWYYYPYQSYPPLNIKWQRPTASRVWNYWILKYINKDKEILDIGWNVGFLSLYLSRFAKHVDIVEYAKYAANIWKYLQEKEKIENVNIINWDFWKYETEKKYDLIMSFAVHWWVWIEFNDYMKKISELLKNDWVFIIESHFIYKWIDRKWDDSHLENQIIDNWIFKIIEKWFSDDDSWVIRNYFILQKK